MENPLTKITWVGGESIGKLVGFIQGEYHFPSVCMFKSSKWTWHIKFFRNLTMAGSRESVQSHQNWWGVRLAIFESWGRGEGGGGGGGGGGGQF